MYKLTMTFYDLLNELELGLIDFQKIENYDAEFNQYKDEYFKLKKAVSDAHDASGFVKKYKLLTDDTSDWYPWNVSITKETFVW